MSEVTRDTLAEVLDEIALLLELKGENPFKVRAYRNGAEVVRSFDGDILLARTVENRKPWDHDLAMGWGALSNGEVRVHELKGNHDTWLTDYTDEFGDLLDGYLRQAP